MRRLQDLRPGERIELGSFPVEEPEMVEFAHRYDPQPFHADPAEGRRSTWGELIASGWLTCSLWTRGLAVEVLNEVEQSLEPAGCDELRWLKPVFPQDVLTASYEVLEVDPASGGLKGLGRVANQKGEEVMTVVVRHRTASGSRR